MIVPMNSRPALMATDCFDYGTLLLKYTRDGRAHMHREREHMNKTKK